MVEDFATRTIEEVVSAPVQLPELPAGCSPGAILGGAAGLALFLYEAAARRERPELAQLARRWLDLARTDREMTPGFIAGAAGVEAVAAIGALHDDNADELLAAARAIDTISARPMATELYEGAAGIAWAARMLLARIPETHAHARAILDGVRDRMIARVLAQYAQPLAPGPHTMLGMAHGIAGEVWTLVVMLGAKHPTVYARLEDLAGLRIADADDLVFWPPALGADPQRGDFGSFCNGMAGHSILWCEVARQLRDEDTLDLARQAAATMVALDGGPYSLCCGLGGHSIALTRCAELLDDAELAREADARMELAIADVARATKERLGLWWGATGLTLAAWSRARMPCFES